MLGEMRVRGVSGSGTPELSCFLGSGGSGGGSGLHKDEQPGGDVCPEMARSDEFGGKPSTPVE